MQTPTNAIRILRHTEKYFLKFPQTVPKCYRTYLSKAYWCEEDWSKRLESPLLKQVNAGEMFFDIDKKFQLSGKVCAVDVDIFANCVIEKVNIDEVTTLLEKLRATAEAANILQSTHHAVVRLILSQGEKSTLWEVLNNRMKYGIFPDAVCYNLLMDTFLESKDFAYAARIATLLMIQEDCENPISTAMALYSCHRYLEKPDEWKAPVVVSNEPVEEVKVRVRYLREPFFDDHLDLTEPSDLVGKTLAFFGKFVGGAEGRSCQLRGLILYKKYGKAVELMDQWVKENKPDVVFKEVIPLIEKDNEAIFKDESNEHVQKVRQMLKKLDGLKLKEGSLASVLEDNIKSAIKSQESLDIEKIKEDYVEWDKVRMSVLQEHLAELNRQEKKKEFAKIKEELASKEQVLTFFDKEEEIELQLEKKLAEEKEKYGHIKLKEADDNEEYVPPDVKKRVEIRNAKTF